MSGPPRTRLDAQTRRDQLIDLGLAMMADRRLEELSVDDIASAAGISRGLLFHYFASKREYAVAVVRAASQILLDATVPDATVDEPERFRSGLKRFIEFLEINPENYIALVRHSFGGDAEIAQVIEETRAAFASRILDSLDPSFPRDAARMAARAWVVMSEEMAIQWLSTATVSRDELVLILETSLLDLLANVAGLSTDVRGG